MYSQCSNEQDCSIHQFAQRTLDPEFLVFAVWSQCSREQECLIHHTVYQYTEKTFGQSSQNLLQCDASLILFTITREASNALNYHINQVAQELYHGPHTYRIWLIAIDLRFRFVSDMSSAPKVIIIAVGQCTPHWDALRTEFPVIRNCCLDVRTPFIREWNESAHGAGFDLSVPNRMKAKETWEVVFRIALVITQEIGLVTVVCNHGKHRSLSVASELASYTDGHLVSISRHQARPLQLRDVTEFMNEVRPHLKRHTNLYSHMDHPEACISVCTQYWEGL